jgi:hypothetical protein
MREILFFICYNRKDVLKNRLKKRVRQKTIYQLLECIIIMNHITIQVTNISRFQQFNYFFNFQLMFQNL